MSNLLFSGYSFQNELITKWFLQNLFQPQVGETQEMQLQVLDYQNNGYEFVTQTSQGQSPSFIFRKVINNVETQLLKYDISSSAFIFNSPLNLSNNKITSLATPSLNTDAATKAYVDTAVSGLGTGTVTSVGISGSSGLTITNSPVISSGVINIDLAQDLRTIAGLNSVGLLRRISSSSYQTIAPGSQGQVLASDNVLGFTWITPNAGTVTSVGLQGGTGLSVSNSPVTSSGTININLNTELQGLSGLNTLGFIYRTSAGNYATRPLNGTSGQFLSLDASLNPIWATPSGSGDVTGPASSTANAIPLYSDSTGKVIKNSPLTVSATGVVSNAGDPVVAQDLVTKNYVDLFKRNFRSGTVIIGDIGSTGTRSRTVTGSLTSAQQSNAYGSGDSFIDIVFSNLGYIPLIFLAWSDPTNSSVCNDIGTIGIQSVTNTTARFYIEETSSVVQNGTLYVLLINPAL